MSGTAETFSDSRSRLAFVDGLRGLTALYVVFHHAWFEVSWTGGERWPAFLQKLTQWLMLGQHGVNIFIVLSGFCLALPLVKDRGATFELSQFFTRRAKRILPSYFAAMAISLLLIAFIPLLQERTNDRWDHALPAWTPQVLVSHLLLIHNLSPATTWSINPPFWSIATEWQIYFVFALVLVPVYRRLGVLAMVLVATITGCLLHVVVREIDQACPWFLVSFSLGAAAAVCAFSQETCIARVRNAINWRWIARLGLIAYAIVVLFFTDLVSPTRVETDLLVAMLFAAVLVDVSTSNTRSCVRQIVECRISRKLGDFSYSLYLMHFPLLAIFHLVLRRLGIDPTIRLAIMFLIAVPVATGFCYLFHLRFERPFLRALSKQRDQVARLHSDLVAATARCTS